MSFPGTFGVKSAGGASVEGVIVHLPAAKAKMLIRSTRSFAATLSSKVTPTVLESILRKLIPIFSAMA